MKMLIIILISVAAYVIGMFITQIILTIYDQPDVVIMIFWPVTVPLIIVGAFFGKLNETAIDIGDRISMKIRNRKDEVK